MATDNTQNNERIDILEAALQALAGAQRLYEETQRQQTAAIQRHDMDMEMGPGNPERPGRHPGKTRRDSEPGD